MDFQPFVSTATSRIALANLPLPASAEDSVRSAVDAIAEAGLAHAHVVCFPECFVPGYGTPSPGSESPSDAQSTIATVNCASHGTSTTSAVIRADRTILCYQTYSQSGLLLADIDLGEATGFLAKRAHV